MPHAPILTLTLEVRALVAEPIDIGVVGRGRRRVVPIMGGTFEGHGELNLRGRVLSGGEDWQLIQDDGVSEVDARYVLEAQTGETISVRNRGVRHAPADVMRRLLAGEKVDPSLVYFKSSPIFETSAPSLQVLVKSIFVGAGERYPNEVVLRFWKVE